MRKLDIRAVKVGDLIQGEEAGTRRLYAGEVVSVRTDMVKIRINYKDTNYPPVRTWLEADALYYWNPKEITQAAPDLNYLADFPHRCPRCKEPAYVGAIRSVKHAAPGSCPDV
jgi:hypothetical protein